MAVYDLEEQEKLDDLKAWWQQNSKYVSAAVVVVALVVIGVQGWRWYQRTQAEQASVLYQAVSQTLARRPNAAFDLVAVAPQSGGSAQIALNSNIAQRDADQVMRSLLSMGLTADRISMSAASSKARARCRWINATAKAYRLSGLASFMREALRARPSRANRCSFTPGIPASALASTVCSFSHAAFSRKRLTRLTVGWPGSIFTVSHGVWRASSSLSKRESMRALVGGSSAWLMRS